MVSQQFRITRLIHRLQESTGAWERDEVRRALVAEGAPAARALLDASSSPRAVIRGTVLQILGEVGGPWAIPHLGAGLKDPSVLVRREAVDGLRRLSERAADGELRLGLFYGWHLRRLLPGVRRLAEEARREAPLSAPPYLIAHRQMREALGEHPAAAERDHPDLPLPHEPAGPHPEDLPLPGKGA